MHKHGDTYVNSDGIKALLCTPLSFDDEQGDDATTMFSYSARLFADGVQIAILERNVTDCTLYEQDEAARLCHELLLRAGFKQITSEQAP